MEASTGNSRPGDGYVVFAATLFLILGIFNVMDGVLALVNDDHFLADELFFGDLTTWGWILLVMGALQILASVRLFSGQGRVLAITLASLNLIAQFMFLPAYPVWSIIIMTIDGIVIYGLAAYADEA